MNLVTRMGHPVRLETILAIYPLRSWVSKGLVILLSVTVSLHVLSILGARRATKPISSPAKNELFPQLLCFENDPSFMGGVYGGVYPPAIQTRNPKIEDFDPVACPDLVGNHCGKGA